MPLEHDDAPVIILANFASAMAVDLTEREVLQQWATQAPREIWLARPGDVLVTPVPLSDPFLEYACSLLGVERASVDVVSVPDVPGLPMGESVRRSPLFGSLRGLAARHPLTRLLPTALDGPTLDLAADLGIPVVPYGCGTQFSDPDALRVTALLNTKAGFRGVADELGMRLPLGRVCRGGELPYTVRELLDRHGPVVIKPDRSAAGHGIRFVSRHDAPVAPEPDAGGLWVVEEFVAHTRSISAQFLAEAGGPRVVFSGEMRTSGGSFTGYRCPLTDVADATVKELEQWGLGLGRHLAARGYLGPYDIDAVLAGDGTLYATESNVRRTATTTPHAMVTRLTHPRQQTALAWLIGKRSAKSRYTFPQALTMLRDAGLAYDRTRGAGIVLYADSPSDGVSWRYAAIGADQEHVTELEAALTSVLHFQ
ncbi:peptide ligase PGM1-related protein [Streptomyces sp. H10-C2]|uniref:preATP grasp domain-containing protein n=1 Tax=unclassified Streptomyces TaxID=2593676 RepID=UPI0024B95528|nr:MULTISPECIES: peptide ligase PGM1-related protein [unclassified Streptomyces]MDJ0346780.1 peptide ligase PGM1-related protein [Streptomyces sp. PH10-H1]MDJ0374090.1 peptide ligase PGM1-related protein [Streptomyces sp. H10-C2]